MLNPCTCGEAHPHKISRRQTADGKDVLLWSDGAITAAMGYKISGVPIRRPRTPEAQRLALKAGWLLMGEVCIYDLAELPDLLRAAERAAKTDGLPGTMRAEFARIRGSRLLLSWVVTATDPRGRVTERQAILPRFRWPDLAVIDHCGSVGGARGRYELFYYKRYPDGLTCWPSGFSFKNLDQLAAHLKDQ